MPIEYYPIFFILLALIGIFEGIKKFSERRATIHKRGMIIPFIIGSVIIFFFDLKRLWEISDDKTVIILFAVPLVVLLIYKLRQESISRKMTIYDIQEPELLQIIDKGLADLNEVYEREIREDGKIIYTFPESKSKITIKYGMTTFENKELILSHAYDFSNTDGFLLYLKEELDALEWKEPKRKGILEIVAGLIAIITGIVTSYYIS